MLIVIFLCLLFSVIGEQSCSFIDDIRMDDYIHTSVQINKYNNFKNNLNTDILLKNNPEIEYLEYNTMKFNKMCGSYIMNHNHFADLPSQLDWTKKLNLKEKTLSSWQEVLVEYTNILNYIKTGNETSFSRKEMIKCSRNDFLEDKLFYLVNRGISFTSNFTSCYHRQNKTRFDTCYSTPIYDRYTIMHILQKQPVLTFIDVEQFDTRYYSQGILKPVNTKDKLFPVVIMGYGYNKLYKTEYWIVYNYLKNWGYSGVGYINRHSFSNIPSYWLEF